MKLERVELFTSKKEFLLFLATCGFILFYSLLIEFNNYKNLTKFNTAIVKAIVLKQYTKSKLTKTGKTRNYQVLKLRADQGFSFYTTQNLQFPHAVNKKISLEISTSKLSFYEYFTHFYSYSKHVKIDDTTTLKQTLNNYLSVVHTNADITDIYQALFSATPLNKQLQNKFSSLGISHLVAISGFHLGVLSAILFFVLKYPYKLLQNRYFPYRNANRDIFVLIASVLLAYLLFLDSPPSLLRSFGMFLIGFILYDRGIKIISMQTLFVSVILLLALFPRLFFSIGFWLSIGGVFYIFLFLLYFKHQSKTKQFLLLPFWVYLMMLPHSLYIFGNFSLYHPLSILLTTLFTLFYPASLFAHLAGFGNFFDPVLQWLVNLNVHNMKVVIPWHVEIGFILLSLLSAFKKSGMWILLFLSLSVFIYAVYQVT